MKPTDTEHPEQEREKRIAAVEARLKQLRLQRPTHEFDPDSAFDAWWEIHGNFYSLHDVDPRQFARVTWRAALEWQRLAAIAEAERKP